MCCHCNVKVNGGEVLVIGGTEVEMQQSLAALSFKTLIQMIENLIQASFIKNEVC